MLEEDHPGVEKLRMKLIKGDDTHYSHTAEVDNGSGYKLEYEKTCHKV